MRSWAVPRGLPDDPRHNRLAVAVPDHDLEHLTSTDKWIADVGWWHEAGSARSGRRVRRPARSGRRTTSASVQMQVEPLRLKPVGAPALPVWVAW